MRRKQGNLFSICTYIGGPDDPKHLRRYVAASPEAARQTGTMVRVSMGNRGERLT